MAMTLAFIHIVFILLTVVSPYVRLLRYGDQERETLF